MTTDNGRTRCSVFSRCMGYIRPVSYYNIGKKAEFHQRINFDNANGKFIDDFS